MKIHANYTEISRTGQTVKQRASEYESQMTQMIARMNELRPVWQGSDAQAFVTQLEGLRPKMMELKAAMDAYGQLLIRDAEAYKSLQANRAANARKL